MNHDDPERAAADYAQTIIDTATADGWEPEEMLPLVAALLERRDTTPAYAMRAVYSTLAWATEKAYYEHPDGEYGPTMLTEHLRTHSDRSVRLLGNLLSEIVAIVDRTILDSADTGAETPTTYAIHRFYRDDTPTEVIETGLTLDEAQEWCRRDDTRGEGWFDGYEAE